MNKLLASFISNSRSQQGFSLVEMAIVLVIIGLLLGLSLPFLSTQIRRTQHTTTRAHQDQIYSALNSYQKMQNDNTLPCPADPKAPVSQRGVANCQHRSCEGLIPYKTLGLPEKVAKDGHNRFFTYAVEFNLTRPLDNPDLAKGGHLTVLDEGGLNVLDPNNKRNFIAFLLISHGETGEGAFTATGTRLPIRSGHKIKKKNADGKSTYQEGSEDRLYWVSQTLFRVPSHPH